MRAFRLLLLPPSQPQTNHLSTILYPELATSGERPTTPGTKLTFDLEEIYFGIA